MLGAVIIAVVVVVVGPVLFWMTWGAMAVVLGWLLKDNAEATHPGSELIETNI